MKQLFYRLISTVLISIVICFQQSGNVYGFTIAEERIIGEKLLYSVRSAFPLLEEPDLYHYINTLGSEVLSVAGLQYFDYRFYVINDDEFNAFAAPSGLVFFYSGLIKSMNNEDELVSVLAHEIGHVAKRHLAGRIEKGKVIGAASLAVALAALALGGGAATQALLTGSLAAGQSANLHYSRKHEEEADLVAYGWMKELQRNPEGQKKMLETMRRVSRYRSDKLPQYLLTHPNPEARLDYVESLLKIDEVKGVSYRKNKDFDFLRFKYRIMSESSDSNSFREYLSSVIGDENATSLARTMAKYGMSQLERRGNNFDQSKKLLDEVIALLPEEKMLITDRGVLTYNSGDYIDARFILEKAYKENAKDMYAAFYLGKTYQSLGELDQAENLYRTVSYKMPEYSKVYFELGKIASQKNQNSLSSLYLGKFYLYEGKLKLARFSLNSLMKDDTAKENEKVEAERLLETIERLEKD